MPCAPAIRVWQPRELRVKQTKKKQHIKSTNTKKWGSLRTPSQDLCASPRGVATSRIESKTDKKKATHKKHKYKKMRVIANPEHSPVRQPSGCGNLALWVKNTRLTPLLLIFPYRHRHKALQQLKDTDPHDIVRPDTHFVSNAHMRGLVWSEFIRNVNTQ